MTPHNFWNLNTIVTKENMRLCPHTQTHTHKSQREKGKKKSYAPNDKSQKISVIGQKEYCIRKK